jgi:hypothetical protein
MVVNSGRSSLPASHRSPSSPGRQPSTVASTVKLAVPAVSVIATFLVDGDGRLLLAPILAIVSICTFFITTIWQRDGTLPLFELGPICVLATAVYSTIPFVGFYLAGSQWPPGVDARLLRYEFDALQIGFFAWRHAAYIAAFVVAYLALRASLATVSVQPIVIPRMMGPALLILLAILYSFKWSMYLVYGLDTGYSYADLEAQVMVMANIPYFLQQFSAAGLASLMVAKLGLLIVVINYFKRSGSMQSLGILVIWLVVEVAAVTIRLGQRTSAVLLVLSAAAVYHHLVKPLRLTVVLAGGSLFLIGFLLLGFVRGDNQAEADLNIVGILTSRNEFQAIFATAYDLFERKQNGLLGDVPWQINFVDLYLEIPSQLLPFEKIDPAAWYIDLIGERGSGVGYMFGVMSQATLGFDWLELIARGAVLGSLFALLHRWYTRGASRFWVTLLYMCVTVWSYYTFRATTFWIVHFVVYQFIPVLVLCKLIQAMLSVGSSVPNPVSRGAVLRRNLMH